MSRETVIALRRFTEKLAYMPVTMQASLPDVRNQMRTNLDEPQGLDRMGNKYEFNTRPFSTADMPYPSSGDAAAQIRDPLSPPPPHYAPPTDPTAGISENNPSFLEQIMQYMPSTPTAIGMGVGGLGAYGLARLLQSEEESKKKRVPWLSTLAGTVGGGALAAYLASQTQSPGTPWASPNHMVDRALTDPRQMAPGLQTTRPRDTSGQI